MKNKLSWIILTVILIALIGGASVLYNKYSKEVERESLMTEDTNQAEIEAGEDSSAEQEPTEDDTQELMKAPDFTVYDGEGNAVSLSDFIGKPVIVNFWASWCGPCKMEMPDFAEKYAEYGDEIYFMMVNMTDGAQETVETAKKFVEDSGHSFPVYFDTDMDAAMTYSVASIPSTYFMDAEGNMVAWAQGMIDAETLQKGIDMITGAEEK